MAPLLRDSKVALEGQMTSCKVTLRHHVGVQVRIGPNTQENDLKVKLDKAKNMVDKKYRVRLYVPYQNKHRDAAVVMLQRLREMCAEFATVAGPELGEKLPPNTIIMYLTSRT